MSRASAFPQQRNLTLTEELEKLEQSITLTLQEIDHNFSRAHRIVTASILPIVEQYAEHSRNVWEGSKFWKQFFEASANVSLSGYEETPPEDETVTNETASEATPSSASYLSQDQQDFTITPNTNQRYQKRDANGDSSSFSSPSQKTPRVHRNTAVPPSIAAFSSPYEALRREIQGTTEEPSASTLPSTPRAQLSSNSTPESSPFLPPSTTKHRTPANDVLLHRVLDKNYRLQATPHAQTRLPKPAAQVTRTPTTGSRGNRRYDNEDPDSSPPMPTPQLRAEIFDSPAKNRRIPGVSVLTPARNTGRKSNVDDGGGDYKSTAFPTQTGIWDSDSDDDGLPEGMSPPKTIQFHIPPSKLLKTPAREASKRIVEDLLLTAGGNITEDDEDSPSVVRRGGLLEEDTF